MHIDGLVPSPCPLRVEAVRRHVNLATEYVQIRSTSDSHRTTKADARPE